MQVFFAQFFLLGFAFCFLSLDFFLLEVCHIGLDMVYHPRYLYLTTMMFVGTNIGTHNKVSNGWHIGWCYIT